MSQPYGHATLLQRLDGFARSLPHKPFLALYRGEQFRIVTYADLARRAAAWAARFADDGHAAGSTVFLILRHGAEAYAAFLGAQRAGLVPAFLPPPSPKQEPARFWATQNALFARTRPAAVVVEDADAEAMSAARDGSEPPLLLASGDAPPSPEYRIAEPDLCAPALIQHSSGTTGLKKAVQLSHEQLDRHVGMLAAALDFTADDVVASWLPLYHDMGLVTGFLAPLTLGASVVALDPFAWAADPSSLLRAVERHRATLCWQPNFAFAHLARTRPATATYDLSSLRAVIDCSEPCRPETIETFCDAFAADGIGAERIACSYGMAEAVFAVTQTTLGAPPRALEVDAERLERASEITAPTGGRTHQFLSCGKPLPGVDLRIAPSTSGGAAGVLTVGEIEVASATLFDGYHHGEGAPVDPPTDGWRATGDIGFLYEGELYVCGRTMERLIVHGRNLYAGDVEAVVSGVEGVKPGRAVALGVLDEATGGEEAWVMLEASRPLADPSAREAVVRRVREAVLQAFDVTLRGVQVGPPGWLAKSTSGKMSRADNLQKLHRLLANESAEDLAAGGFADPQAPATPLPPAPVLQTVAEASPTPPPAPRIEGPARAAVVQALAECFGPAGARLGDEAGFGEAPGWDSLGHTILAMRLQALTGCEAPEAGIASARTVGRLIALFDGLMSEPQRAAA